MHTRGACRAFQNSNSGQIASWTSLFNTVIKAKFSYGPFREIPIIPDDDIVLSPEVLKKTLRKSFPLMLNKFLLSLSTKDFENLQQLTRPRLYSEIEQLFKKREVKLEILNSGGSTSANIEYVKEITKLWGFNPSAFNQEELKARGEGFNMFPGFKIKRILYKPKGFFPRPFWFQGVVLCDVLMNVDHRVKITESKKNGGVQELLKQRELGPVNYVVQFICKSQYEALAPPGLNEAPPFEVKDSKSVNLQFWSLEKQADYEAQGWKINDINGFLKKDNLLDCL